jgi:hypothetical protein
VFCGITVAAAQHDNPNCVHPHPLQSTGPAKKTPSATRCLSYLH